MAIKTSLRDIAPYVTKDGSRIRELMHPHEHGNRLQSLAEAMVPVGEATALHRHGHTEELYHITAGRGLMTVEHEQFEVAAGDTVCIPPGVLHRIENIGNTPLHVLCCCAPPYSHDDTELSDGGI